MKSWSVSALFEIGRPLNAIGAAALALTGAFVAGGTTTEAPAVLAAGIATAFAVGAGNTLNDYFDREIDSINRPERAIPRGAVEPRVALVWAGLLFACAVALTLTLPLPAIGIAFLNLFLLLTYTTWFKGVPAAGNLVVAYLVGTAFLFGGAAVGDTVAVIELATLAGLATFAREVIKDVEDIEGDRAEGLETLPIVVGEDTAAVIGAAALIGAVFVSPLPVVTGTFGIEYILVVLVADGLAIAAARSAFQSPGRSQRLTKGAMFVAVVAFVAGQAGVYTPILFLGLIATL